MNRIRFGLVLLFLMFGRSLQYATIGPFSHIGNAIIEDDAIVGSFDWIDDGVTVSQLAQIGDHSRIGSNTFIGRRTQIRNHVHIGSECVFNRSVLVLDHASIGSRVTFESNAQVNGHARVGDGSVIGHNSLIMEHVRLINNVRVGQNAIVGSHSNVGDSVVIEDLTYVGLHTTIERNVLMGRQAVVHEFAYVPDGFHIPEKQIVLAAPTTQMLINIVGNDPMACDSFNASQQQVNQTDDSSSEFNTSIMNLMTQQWDELMRSCSRPTIMSGLSCIVRQYLVEYYGQQRFDELVRLQTMGFNFVSDTNSNVTEANYRDLVQTHHFGSNAAKNILSPTANTMLIQLLTMQKDIQRILRTIGDEQCQMMQDIHDNRRDVVVTEAPVSSMAVSISHNNFNNIMQSTYSLSG